MMMLIQANKLKLDHFLDYKKRSI